MAWFLSAWRECDQQVCRAQVQGPFLTARCSRLGVWIPQECMMLWQPQKSVQHCCLQVR